MLGIYTFCFFFIRLYLCSHVLCGSKVRDVFFVAFSVSFCVKLIGVPREQNLGTFLGFLAWWYILCNEHTKFWTRVNGSIPSIVDDLSKNDACRAKLRGVSLMLVSDPMVTY